MARMHAQCKSCGLEKSKKWREDRMLRKQDDCCGICKRHKSEFKVSLSVDHDHETGEVRKLLCSGCNTALGLLKENFDCALALAKYIQEYKGTI